MGLKGGKSRFLCFKTIPRRPPDQHRPPGRCGLLRQLGVVGSHVAGNPQEKMTEALMFVRWSVFRRRARAIFGFCFFAKVQSPQSIGQVMGRRGQPVGDKHHCGISCREEVEKRVTVRPQRGDQSVSA